MANYDFKCPTCDILVEISCKIADRENAYSCATCGNPLIRQMSTPITCTTIIPYYPGSKKVSAGYVHSHGDKNATKTLSGPYGCVNKKD